MFGYVKPDKPELKIREFEVYRAYYCAICKSIGQRIGQLPRLILNFDFAFLAVLLSSMDSNPTNAKRERCIAHPLKKRSVVKTDKAVVDYAADMNILLAFYNLEDKVRDDRALLPAAGMQLLKRAVKKVKKSYPEKCAIIEEKLLLLNKMEKEKCASMDLAAEPFAGLMEEIFNFEGSLISNNDRKILKWIGYNIGKWIYLIDAYDDLGKDIKKRQYNPLIFQFEYGGEESEAFKAKLTERVEFNLTQALSQISTSIELLDIKKNKGIIENIVYCGLLEKTDFILKGTGSCRKREKSV